MLLIICKVELKLKWLKHCVLAIGSNDNDDANSNNVIVNIKDTNLYVLYSLYQQKITKNYKNFLARDLKD